MELLAFESIYTAFLAFGAFAYVLYRQWVSRPLTRIDFVLPMLGGLYLGARYLQAGPSPAALVVQASAVVGIATGLLAGHLVRVWRDGDSGLAYQYGGTRYAAVVAALLVTRVLWDLGTHVLRIDTNVGMLNDSFLALTLGNYFGRNLHVGARALHLVGWNPKLIPTRRQIREVKNRARNP